MPPRTHDVRCPKCGETYRAELVDAIDATLEPALKAELLSSRLFERACPACGARWHAARPLLYHDRAKLLLLWLHPGETTDQARSRLGPALEGMIEPDLRPAYTMRLVRSPLDLIEKVFIFDAALSDMIIEVLKVTAAGLAPAAQGAELRFSPTHEGQLIGRELPFAVVRPGEKVGRMSVPGAHYERVAERFPGIMIAFEAAKGGPIMVDQAFALEIIKSAAGAQGP
ncbi:MAG TPA: CpXC domain-containing protein [Polyangiaceae bacterium]|nr:CpXC domain-containing protein [Polyangiaceae bacterium]